MGEIRSIPAGKLWAGRITWGAISGFILLLPLTLWSVLPLAPLLILGVFIARHSLRPVAWGAIPGGAGVALLLLALIVSDPLGLVGSAADIPPVNRDGLVLLCIGIAIEIVRVWLLTGARTRKSVAEPAD